MPFMLPQQQDQDNDPNSGDTIERDDSVLSQLQSDNAIDPSFQSVNQQQQDQQAQSALAALNKTTLNPEQYTAANIQNLEGRKQLTQQQGDVATQGAQQEAAIQAQAAADQQQQLLAQKVFMQKAMRDAQRRDDDLRTAVAGMSKEKVDPNHWWNSKSTTGKVMANIGILLGGMGQGLMVGAGAVNARNQALDQINKAIDNDIDAQKENIGNHFKQLMLTHSLNEDSFTRSLHEQEWRNQYRIGGLEVVKQQLAANAANTNNKMVQLNAQQAMKDIDQQQNDLRYKNWQYRQNLLAQQHAGQAALDKKLEAEQVEANKQVIDLMNNADHPMSEADARSVVSRLHPQLVQYGRFQAGKNGELGSPMTNIPTSKAQTEREQAAAKDERERTVIAPDGKAYVANNKDQANDAALVMRANVSMEKSLDELDALQKKYEAGQLSYSDIQRWKTIRGDITNKYNETYGVKRQSGQGEGARIEEDMLPEPPTMPSWVSGHNGGQALNPFIAPSRAKLDQFRQLIKNGQEATMGQLTPVQGQEAPAPKSDGINFTPKAPSAPKPTGPAPKPIPNIMQGQGSQSIPSGDTNYIPSYQEFTRRGGG